ncbi:hypothetical protein [Spirosoma harenae]
MKRIFFVGSLLSSIVCGNVWGVSLSRSTVEPDLIINQQPTPSRPVTRPTKRNTEKPLPDSTSPGKRKQPRLRPDSLRRGGATKVDTVR